MADPLKLGPAADAGHVSPTALGCLAIVGRMHGVNLSVEQMVRDNLLSRATRSRPNSCCNCARKAGFRCKTLNLKWGGILELNQAMPCIVRFRNGSSMVLLRLDMQGGIAKVVLQDPNADADNLLIIDRIRFEDAWSGDTILIKRNYAIEDETKPFGFGLIATLIFRERRIVARPRHQRVFAELPGPHARSCSGSCCRTA